MRKTASVIAIATAIATGTTLFTGSATAVPPPSVQFRIDGHRLLGTAMHLPVGTKTCGFERSQTNPGTFIGSFGNDMISVGKRRSDGDTVAIRSRPMPPGRYLLQMSCFIKQRKTPTYRIVAVNEAWVQVTRARQSKNHPPVSAPGAH